MDNRHSDRADVGGGADGNERWGSGMTEQEREELIGRIALQIGRAQFGDWVINPTEKMREQARAVLAVAEPVIREQADNALREKNELLMQAWNEEKGFLNKYIDKIEHLRAENACLREALVAIAKIKNELYGPDWQEIEKARKIARAAIREGGKDG